MNLDYILQTHGLTGRGGAAPPAPSTGWAPDPSWAQDLATWTPAGGIGMIMDNSNFGKMTFTVGTASAQYTVVVNDGTTDILTTNYNSYNPCTISVPPGDGSTNYAIKITSASEIRRFTIGRSASIPSGTQFVPLLYFYGNLSTLTNCESMFYNSANGAKCAGLQAVEIISTANVTTMVSMFEYCTSLQYVPKTMDTANVTLMTKMFSECTILQSVPEVMNTVKVTNMQSMFSGCFALQSVPSTLNAAIVTTMQYMFSSCYSLQSIPSMTNFAKLNNITNMFYAAICVKIPVLDLSTAVITAVVITTCVGIQGLIVSSTASWGTSSPQINITDCGLNRTALIALFNSLGNVTGKTIKVTGNVGTPDLQAADIAIATGKGWTVTTT